MDFFNKDLLDEFRKKISSSQIFPHSSDLISKYDLICAVLDRLDSSIDYLNENQMPPKNEHDFLVFIMYSCTVCDAIKQLCKGLHLHYPFLDTEDESNYIFFKDICMNTPLDIPEEKCPTDDKFFEYFRSVSMAHPFLTDRPKFFEDSEIHYSPFLLAGSAIRRINDGVGVRVYTNRYTGFESIKDIYFSFSILKRYIQSRFQFIEKVISWADNQIQEYELMWKKRKVNRFLSPLEVLKDIKQILLSRYEKTYDIDIIIDYLNTETTLSVNDEAIKIFRENIEAKIPKLCDHIDELKHLMIGEVLYNEIEMKPESAYTKYGYELEKIFSYLNSYTPLYDVNFGLEMVQSFQEKIGSKYVTIKPTEMNFDEIKLLVRTACFLGFKDDKSK